MQLTDALRQRHDAEQALADSRAKLQEASRRRWGRYDNSAIAAARDQLILAEKRLEHGIAAEGDVRDRLAAITHYQEARHEVIASKAPEGKELESALAQLDAALDGTRAGRVLALVNEPPAHLVERLARPPGSPAGRAVWCYYALGIEATLDRNDGKSPPWTGWSQQTRAAREEIAVADRLFDTSIAPEPTEWANLAREAATLREHVHRTAAVRRVTHQLLTPRAGQPQWSTVPQGWVPEEGQGPSL